jgi:outer membrane protein
MLAPTSAFAQTLGEAMQNAEATNPALAASRQRLEAAREQLPQAFSEILPQVGLSGGATAFKSHTGGIGDSNGESWSGDLTISQLLYAGGRVGATTRQARADIAAAEANYRDITQTLLLDVTRAYTDLRQARQVVEAREKTVSNLQQQVKFQQAQFETGVTTRTSVAQAEARLAQAQTQLVQAQGTLAATTETFLRLVGMPPEGLTAVATPAGLPADPQAALAVAVERSPIVLSAAANELSADAAVDLAASAGRPNLSLQAGSGLSGDFGDRKNDRDESVGVRLSIPLFTGGLNASRTRQQKKLLTAAKLDRDNVDRVVRESVTTAWTNLQAARSAQTSAAEQLRAAEIAYEGIRLEQDAGLRTNIEVLEQEQDLLDARLALAQAERDVAVAENALLAAMGTLDAPYNDALKGRVER